MAKALFHVSDYPELMRELAVYPEAFDPENEDTFIYAPCCRRVVIACAVADVRKVRGTIVSGGGVRPEKDHNWLCDGCRMRLANDPRPLRELPNGQRIQWTESGLMEARGAPPEMYHRIREEEWMTETRSQAAQRDEGLEPEAVRALFRERLAQIRRSLKTPRPA